MQGRYLGQITGAKQMSNYTIKSIRKTAVYKANIAAVKAIYPGHALDFARELKTAANSPKVKFKPYDSRIIGIFSWGYTPQGYDCWRELHRQIKSYNARKAAA